MCDSTKSDILREVIRKGVLSTLNVERIRKEKGLTQSELAEKMNVTQGAISMIETGERKPSFDVLCRMAEVLDVTIDELIRKAG